MLNKDTKQIKLKVSVKITVVVLYYILGHLQAKLVYYLMNIHIRPRSIYLCRVSLSDHMTVM